MFGTHENFSAIATTSASRNWNCGCYYPYSKTSV